TQRVSCPPHRPPGSPTIFVSSAAGRRSGRPLQWLGLADGTRPTSQGSNPAGTHPRDTGPAPPPATPAHPPGRRPSSHRLAGPSTGSGRAPPADAAYPGSLAQAADLRPEHLPALRDLLELRPAHRHVPVVAADLHLRSLGDRPALLAHPAHPRALL